MSSHYLALALHQNDNSSHTDFEECLLGRNRQNSDVNINDEKKIPKQSLNNTKISVLHIMPVSLGSFL